MALTKIESKNFDTLLRAAAHGRLALLECTDASSGERRAVICAMSDNGDDETLMVPFGHLHDGNPYEAYIPPAGIGAGAVP